MNNIRHQEIEYQNPFLCIKIWERERHHDHLPDFRKKSWHYHKEVELLLILEGELSVHTPEENWLIKPGDVLLLGSSQLHLTHRMSLHVKYIVFQIHLEAHFDQTVMMHLKHFRERFHPLSALNAMLLHNAQAQQKVRSSIIEILNEMQQENRGYEMAVSLLVKTILLTLIRLDGSDVLEYSRLNQYSEMDPALLYIDKHYTEKLEVSDVCRRVNVSYHHFHRLFRKATGMSFTQYVNYKRIKRSEQLLLTEDMSIDDIAYTVGMPNRAHFYKIFERHHGCSPGQFQRIMKQKGITDAAPVNEQKAVQPN